MREHVIKFYWNCESKGLLMYWAVYTDETSWATILSEREVEEKIKKIWTEITLEAVVLQI